jgi:hypothetical protein
MPEDEGFTLNDPCNPAYHKSDVVLTWTERIDGSSVTRTIYSFHARPLGRCSDCNEGIICFHCGYHVFLNLDKPLEVVRAEK